MNSNEFSQQFVLIFFPWDIFKNFANIHVLSLLHKNSHIIQHHHHQLYSMMKRNPRVYLGNHDNIHHHIDDVIKMCI